jgi:hypothetical protein
MGARPYDPGLGRFVTTDPIDGGSFNAYDYAGQDPINVYDLNGQTPCWLDPVCLYHTVKGADQSPLAHNTVHPFVKAAKALNKAAPIAAKGCWNAAYPLHNLLPTVTDFARMFGEGRWRGKTRKAALKLASREFYADFPIATPAFCVGGAVQAMMWAPHGK